MRRLISLALCCALLAGCGKRREKPETALIPDDSGFVLVILLDLSGSFSNLMANDGKGYEFALQVIDRYFRDQMGSNSKIIIAQISAQDRSLLWQGTAVQLRREFPTAGKFRDFLLQKADPGGSLVHDAITQTVEYVMSDPAVSSGKAKSAVFVLSDLIDNGGSSDSKDKVIQALTAYGKSGGTVGLYYVDQHLVSEWRRLVRDAGVQHCCVESEIVGKPTLPSFE